MVWILFYGASFGVLLPCNFLLYEYSFVKQLYFYVLFMASWCALTFFPGIFMNDYISWSFIFLVLCSIYL